MIGRRGRSGLAARKPTRSLLLGPTPDLSLLTAAGVFFLLAGFGGLAFSLLAHLAFGAGDGFDFSATTIFFLTTDCTGPAYVEATPQTLWSPTFVVGQGLSGDYPSGGPYLVSSTTVQYTRGEPLSGYDPNIGGGTQCENGGAGGLGPNSRNTQLVRQLTPFNDVPSALAGPLTYER